MPWTVSSASWLSDDVSTSVSVSSACSGLAACPKAYSDIESALRLAFTNAVAACFAARNGAPFIERLTSSATPIAAAEPPPDWVVMTGLPFSVAASETFLRSSLFGAITVAVMSG